MSTFPPDHPFVLPTNCAAARNCRWAKPGFLHLLICFSPLCIEEFDLSDKNFRPCPCGYQVSLSYQALSASGPSR